MISTAIPSPDGCIWLTLHPKGEAGWDLDIVDLSTQREECHVPKAVGDALLKMFEQYAAIAGKHFAAKAALSRSTSHD